MSRTKRKTKSTFEKRQSKRFKSIKNKKQRRKEEAQLSKTIDFSNRRPNAKQLHASMYMEKEI